MIDLKLEVGARVRVNKDLSTGGPEPRIYLHEGAEGIVTEIHPNPETLAEDEAAIGVQFNSGEDYLDEENFTVITSAADVDKEPKEFTVTGRLVVEVTHILHATDFRDAARVFREMKSDLLDDWSELEVIKVKKLDPNNIAEKGIDY